MLSLVSTLKLKVHHDEDGKMIVEDGYLRYFGLIILMLFNHASFDKLVVILILILL